MFLIAQIYSLKYFFNFDDLKIIFHSQFNITRNKIYLFIKPLFFSTILIYFANFIDRFLLLHYNNYDEQGFFGLAFRLSGISFILISALTQLLIREFVQIDTEKRKIHKLFNIDIFSSIIFFFS